MVERGKVGISKMTTREERERQDAITRLRIILQPDDTVYTILKHVSSSGMLRAIAVIVTKNNEPLDISWLVARALGWKLHRKYDGVKVSGCGMDMGFHLVYSLSSTLYYAEAEKLHETMKLSKNHNMSQNFRERNGGYWLKQKWL